MSIYKNVVIDYLMSLDFKENKLLKEVRNFAIKNNIPTLSEFEGKFLHLMVKAAGAKKILELGTGIGYSTIWMASNDFVEDLITVEFNSEYSNRARNFFDKAKLGNIVLVEQHTADILSRVEEKFGIFDMVFMDHYKDYYLSDLDMCIKLLKKGGIFIAHNALEGGWATGKVEDDLKNEKLKKFHKVLLSNNLIDSMILPLGEGFAFAIKK